MTRDDIIRMAREAGWKDLREFDSEMRDDIFMGKTQDLERFAALVAAAERESCARVAQEEMDNSLDCCWSTAKNIVRGIRARSQQ